MRRPAVADARGHRMRIPSRGPSRMTGGPEPAPKLSRSLPTGLEVGTRRRRYTPVPLTEANCRSSRVRATIPAERLIDWQPGDGWEPICTHLGLRPAPRCPIVVLIAEAVKDPPGRGPLPRRRVPIRLQHLVDQPDERSQLGQRPRDPGSIPRRLGMPKHFPKLQPA